MEKLEKHIRQFYEAILHTRELPSPYDNFPFGCCQDASWILHRHLFENCYISVELVGGEYHGDNGEYMSHAWLEFDGTIIDITYSQFNAVNAFVITKEWDFHKKFIESYRHRRPYWETYTDDHTTVMLDLFYSNVIKNLNNSGAKL